MTIKEMIEIEADTEDYKGAMRTSLEFGNTEEALTNGEKMLECYERLAEYSLEEFGDDLAEECTNIAKIYKSLGDTESCARCYRRAIEVYTKLIELPDKSNNKWYTAELAISCYKLGELTSDKELYIRAYELAKTVPYDKACITICGLLKGLADGSAD